MLREIFPPTSGQRSCESGGCSPHLVCVLRRGQDTPRVYLDREIGPQMQELPAHQGSSCPKSGTETARSSEPEESQGLGQRGLWAAGTCNPDTDQDEQVSNDDYDSTAPQLSRRGTWSHI